MWECNAINNTGVLYPIPDLGIRLNPGEMRSLSAVFTYDQIKSSRNLYSAVDSQSIIINNGSKNLNRKKGLSYISY